MMWHWTIFVSVFLFFFCGVLQSFSRNGRLEDLLSKKAVWFLPWLVFIGLVESAAYGLCAIYLYSFCPLAKESLVLAIFSVFLISSSVWLAGYCVAKFIRFVLSLVFILISFWNFRI